MNTPYLIGIDLGTTNTGLAYIERKGRQKSKIKNFSIPQLVKSKTMEPREVLASALYLSGEFDLPPESLSLPWDLERMFAVGEFARVQGQKVPGRLVHSAKSWLCHSGVDRRAQILPWGAPEEINKISPIEASASYLSFLKESWNHFQTKIPQQELQNQAIVVTVPAAFDQVARELTVEAAQNAGLENITLLEEPMAAFYHWIYCYRNKWPKRIKGNMLALVCDIGGGTTDFSLIEVRREEEKLDFKRVAVGDHLLLGGDNMDLALALHLESLANKKLDPQQLIELIGESRKAKEILWSNDSLNEYSFTIAGRGSSIIGGSQKFKLKMDTLKEVILNGFFPLESSELFNCATTKRSGFREWGLPFETEPAITKHLSKFLRHHLPPDRKPDLVLFNGGSLTPEIIRERIITQLTKWFSKEQKTWKPIVLNNKNLDLAVASGAAYFNLVRHGEGIRIGGGIARSYYLGIETSDNTPQAICILPFATNQDETLIIEHHPLEVRARQLVSFPLYSSTIRKNDPLGEIVSIIDTEMISLVPIQTILKVGKKAKKEQIPIKLSVGINEVGTLDVHLLAKDSDRCWRLQFQLAKPRQKNHREQIKIIPISKLQNTLGETFILNTHPPQTLMRRLEQVLLSKKNSWELTANRQIWDILLKQAAHRTKSAGHEERWLNLIGFCLRPGIGFPEDDWRIKKLSSILQERISYPRSVPVRLEWWVLWRRVAGGLNEQQQLEVFRQLSYHILPESSQWFSRKPLYRHAKYPEIVEMWRTASSLENLPLKLRYELGEHLCSQFTRHLPKEHEYWVLGRLGSRTPFYSQNVIPPEKIVSWIEILLNLEDDNFHRFYAMAQLSRKTDDRVIDIKETLRQQVLEILARNTPRISQLYALVAQAIELDSGLQKHYLGDSLPPGLFIET